MRAVGAAAAGVLAVVACGSFGSASDDTSTMTDGGPSTSSSSSSGAVGADGGPAPPDGAIGEGGGAFCQAQRGSGSAVFCEDFETGQPPVYSFMSPTTGFVFTAAPGSQSSTAMQLSAGTANPAVQGLTWTYPGTATKFLGLHFQVRIGKVPNSTPDAVLARFKCADGPGFIAMKLRPNAALKVQVSDNDDTDAMPMPLDTWKDVSLSWDLENAKYHVDGGTRRLEISSGSDTCGSPVDIILGFSNWNDPPSDEWQVTFDNVWFEAR